MRIHVTGGPGAGKTHAAMRLADALGAPVFHLDYMAFDLEAGLPPAEAVRRLSAMLPDIYERDAWVSDGIYLGWATPLLEYADVVVWIDTPAPIALFRIVARHVKAEIKGDNRFPGWIRMLRLLYWSARYYLGLHRHLQADYGLPETNSHLRELLRPFEAKLVVCRGDREFDAFLRRCRDAAKGRAA
jgi:adenylate kinase family enzyme